MNGVSNSPLASISPGASSGGTSPVCTRPRASTLSGYAGWTAAAPGAVASRGSTSAGSGSQSMGIRSSVIRSSVASSPASAAIASPR